MAVTLSELAKTLSLSPATVSCILNGKTARFNVDTVKRVQAAAEMLDYRPNRAARAMRLSAGQYKTFVLLTSPDATYSYLPPPLFTGISEQAQQRDLQLSVAQVPSALLFDPDHITGLLREQTADGVLMNIERNVPDHLPGLIERLQIPAVWLNSAIGRDHVGPDDVAAITQAVDMLVDLGHRRIVYADFINDLYTGSWHASVTDRQRGYVQAMQAHDLRPQVVRNTDKLLQPDWRSIGERLLRDDDRPTAVVSYSIDTALHILLAATNNCGLQVPQDLSLVSLIDDAGASYSAIVDGLLMPLREVGQRAVDVLKARVDGKDLLPWEWPGCQHQQVGSVGPAPTTIVAARTA